MRRHVIPATTSVILCAVPASGAQPVNRELRPAMEEPAQPAIAPHAIGGDPRIPIAFAGGAFLPPPMNAASLITALDDALPDDILLVSLTAPVTVEQRWRLRDLGIVLVSAVTGRDWFARVQEPRSEELAASGLLYSVGVAQRTWKLDPFLNQGASYVSGDRLFLRAQGRELVELVLMPDATPAQIDALSQMLAVIGGNVRDIAPSMPGPGSVGEVWTAEIPLDEAEELAALGAVQFIGVVAEYESHCEGRWGILEGGDASRTPFRDAGITGLNEIVGVLDSNYTLEDCGLVDREGDAPGPMHRKVASHRPGNNFPDHGTWVAQVLGGANGFTNGSASCQTGAASGSRLVLEGTDYATDFLGNPIPSSIVFRRPIQESYIEAMLEGAAVHNNSWGSVRDTLYTRNSAAVDQFLFQDPMNVVVFSAGNHRSAGVAPTAPGNSKNCISVGATNVFVPDSICLGPTAVNGRFKPDVLATGCGIHVSGSSGNCNPDVIDGTSFAAPQVSGMAALFRQYFRNGLHFNGLPDASLGFVPSGPLIKAMIANSARDVSSAVGYPSTREGWGLVHGDRAAVFFGDRRKLQVFDIRADSGVAQGQTFTSTIEVNGSQEPLRISLAYYDAPSPAGLGFAPLINDLDLIVTAPDGAVYRGNQFVTYFDLFQGTVSTGVSRRNATDRDRVNTVEQVILQSPVPGVYRIEVQGRNVAVGQTPAGRVGFGVVATGQIRQTVQRSLFSDDFEVSRGWQLFGQSVLSWSGGTPTPTGLFDFVRSFPINQIGEPPIGASPLSAGAVVINRGASLPQLPSPWGSLPFVQLFMNQVYWSPAFDLRGSTNVSAEFSLWWAQPPQSTGVLPPSEIRADLIAEDNSRVYRTVILRSDQGALVNTGWNRVRIDAPGIPSGTPRLRLSIQIVGQHQEANSQMVAPTFAIDNVLVVGNVSN